MNYNSDLSMSEINNVLESAILPPIKGINNITALYFRKYLFQKLLSAFKWSLPELWNKDYFQYILYGIGYICVFDSGTDGFGVIPQRCGIFGYNLYYQPRQVVITNPLLPNTRYKTINEDCVVLKINPNYTGVLDIIDYYAVKMAMLSADLESNLFNSKLSYLFTVKNQATANAVKKLYDKIAEGDPAVVVDKDLRNEDGSANWEVFQQNLSGNYIASDLLQDMRRIENEFCCKVGIPTTNTEKRERMSEVEVTRNDIETESLIDGWIERLTDDINKVNHMFPNVNIKVERRWNNDGNIVSSGSV
ncbi:MAG: hypothetical protein J6U97_06770 [Bacteroidaceae bacterium]|nr:hypothetical protein [Bacteroidaceae bacterium]